MELQDGGLVFEQIGLLRRLRTTTMRRVKLTYQGERLCGQVGPVLQS
jgi:hypothetical protein